MSSKFQVDALQVMCLEKPRWMIRRVRGDAEFDEAAAGALQRVRADVEVCRGLRATPRLVEREAAGEAEHVQHVAAARHRAGAPAVIALVEEESGLLSAHHVGFEADSRFEKNHRPN